MRFLLINFDSDPKVLATERLALTLFDAISLTGGLMDVNYIRECLQLR